MNKKWNIVFILLLGISLTGCVATSTFQSSERFKGSVYGTEDEIELTGKIFMPEGQGPFPAIVMLHRCVGIKSYDHIWAKKFQSWGYVAFIIDSFGPRNKTQNCGMKYGPGSSDRAMDAYSAKQYLSTLPYVIPDKIAIIGWSDGAKATVVGVDNKFYGLLPPEMKNPFTAAIAFYPYCANIMDNLNAPLLILIGDKDTGTPASECFNRMPMTKTKHEVNLKIYESVYHCFDCVGIEANNYGYRSSYNRQATQKAEMEAKMFLDKYLK